MPATHAPSRATELHEKLMELGHKLQSCDIGGLVADPVLLPAQHQQGDRPTKWNEVEERVQGCHASIAVNCDFPPFYSGHR